MQHFIRKSAITIQIWYNLTSFRIYLSLYRRSSQECIIANGDAGNIKKEERKNGIQNHEAEKKKKNGIQNDETEKKKETSAK